MQLDIITKIYQVTQTGVQKACYASIQVSVDVTENTTISSLFSLDVSLCSLSKLTHLIEFLLYPLLGGGLEVSKGR